MADQKHACEHVQDVDWKDILSNSPDEHTQLVVVREAYCATCDVTFWHRPSKRRIEVETEKVEKKESKWGKK